MKILTAQEMGEADRRSVEMGVPIATLMENAGAAVAKFCLRQYAAERTVLVLCGKGNNGGDGFVAARYLGDAGRSVRIALLGAASDVKGEAAAALERAKSQQGIEFLETQNEDALRAAFEVAELVIDAVVGTGFKPPLRGLAVAARELLAKTTVPVVAVDLPSGWDADSLAQKAETFRADAVVTFAAPKLAHVFGHLTVGKTFGPVVVAPIGTPDAAVESRTGLHWAGAAKALTETPRDINGNKGKFGHVLIVGGAFGKAGAPSMASLAAMRAGAGLVTAAIPREILPTVAAVAPELMLEPLEQETESRKQETGNSKQQTAGLSLKHLEEGPLAKLLTGIKVVGIGPGLGTSGSTPEFVRGFVERVTLPMVIDADALNAFAGRTELLENAVKHAESAGRSRTIVLTPHPGEMARLAGMTVKEVEADRIGLARRFATENGVTLVLKGWRTIIAHPDGRIGVNTTGNPSMAKGGSGDILTGIVAAMLAQHPEDVAQAVEAAVFLHGLAGDFAALAQDEHTVLATDTVGHLWQAFRSRVIDIDGFTWIAGGAAHYTKE
jgi:ADP-dependent NAD(P)H-hydrate dehydratase / NAD(P)H-hydrate epimerase